MNAATVVEKKRERKTEEQVIAEVRNVLEFARDFFRQRGLNHALDGVGENPRIGLSAFFLRRCLHFHLHGNAPSHPGVSHGTRLPGDQFCAQDIVP